MTNKEIAIEFLRLTSGGNPREAFGLYVAQDFKHHNAYFKGDKETLILGMEASHKEAKNKVFETLRALEDGALVAVHSRIVKEGANGWEGVVMHIFRFEEDKIVELWDFGQALPDEMVNENGMF